MIDSKTGLPELPEGYFFRVEKREYTKYHYVAIYRKVSKRFLLWTYTEDQKQIFEKMVYPVLTKYTVRDAAEDCMQQWEDWKNRDTSLLGDYPPKKLEM